MLRLIPSRPRDPGLRLPIPMEQSMNLSPILHPIHPSLPPARHGPKGRRQQHGLLPIRAVFDRRQMLSIHPTSTEIRGGFHFGPTKTYRVRAVVLPASFATGLPSTSRRADTDADALVFTAPKGGPLRRKEFGVGYWKPALEEAGMEPLRVHDLRHTCASLLIATGANPRPCKHNWATPRYR